MGNPEAMSELAFMYAVGRGLNQSVPMALVYNTFAGAHRSIKSPLLSFVAVLFLLIAPHGDITRPSSKFCLFLDSLQCIDQLAFHF